MAINLTKGQNQVLTGVTSCKLGLSWDAPEQVNGYNFDLDAMAIGLTAKDGKLVNEDNFVYFNHLHNSNSSIKHSGDNLTGEGAGDDEVISVDFTKLPAEVNAILFFVDLYDAKGRKQNFGQAKNPKARLYFGNDTVPELVYELDEDFSACTTVEICMLYKHNGEWKFKAVGEGNSLGATAEVNKYK